MARYFPSLQRQDELHGSAYVFERDICLGIMPFRYVAPANPAIDATIDGLPDHVKAAERLLADLSTSPYHNQYDAISDSIEKIAQSLAMYGCAYYELLRDSETGLCVGFSQFTHQRLFSIWGSYIQIVPKADQVYWQKKMTRLESSNVWKISMPSILRGEKGHRQLLKRLSKFPSPFPAFVLKQFSSNKHSF